MAATDAGNGTSSALGVLASIAAYDVVQNLLLPDRAYVPANLAVTGALVRHALRAGATTGELGLEPGRIPSGLVWGGASVAMVAVAVGLVPSRLRDTWLLDERARGHGSSTAAFRAAIRFPIGTALFEEVAFRGVLDGLWRRERGAGSARLVTAVAFGAWHLLPTYRLFPLMAGATGSPRARVRAAVAGSVATGLGGLLFTALRERSGSVAAPWLLHASLNAGSYLLARRAWRRSGEGDPVTRR